MAFPPLLARVSGAALFEDFRFVDRNQLLEVVRVNFTPFSISQIERPSNVFAPPTLKRGKREGAFLRSQPELHSSYHTWMARTIRYFPTHQAKTTPVRQGTNLLIPAFLATLQDTCLESSRPHGPNNPPNSSRRRPSLTGRADE